MLLAALLYIQAAVAQTCLPSEIAYKVQQNIMTAVQNMAGIKVKKVNVHVVGVEFVAEEN